MIVRAQHVIVALDLMVDVMNARPAPRRQCDGVMDSGDAHQCDVADPVTDPRVADLCPELLVPCGMGGAQADMAETGDSGISCREVALATAFRPNHQLDLMAGRIIEADERLYLAQSTF